MIKEELDKYLEQYETKEFIKEDPIQFIHRYKTTKDAEIAGFIASMFSYGKREVFIEKLNYIFNLMENKPYEYIKAFDYKDNNIKNCDYRFSKDCDLIQILEILNKLYTENESLETLFEYNYKRKQDVWDMFQGVTDYFYARKEHETTRGFYHLLPNPAKNSALKRLNMLMRWFIRKSNVDIGIWDFMPKSELLIPLDTHVARISRKLGILTRKDNGRESVMEITQNLRKFDPEDPVKYDFAIFSYGINHPEI